MDRLRSIPLPRINRRLLVRVWLVILIGWVIYSGPVSFADDAITPTGMGGFFVVPDMAQGGPKVFVEEFFGSGHYLIDYDVSVTQILELALNGIANLLMLVLWFFVMALVMLTWYLFSLTTIDGLSDSVANIMGASATTAVEWMLPTALAIGGVIAFATRKNGDNGGLFNNIAWLVVAGTLAVTMASSPRLFTDGIDTIRGAGAELVGTVGGGITADGGTPIDYPNPAPDELEGSSRDKMMRQSSDALWRTLVVTPWCLAELGSIEACKVYGADIVTHTQGDERSAAIKDMQDAQKGSGTDEWLKGNTMGTATARVAIIAVGLIVAAAFALVLAGVALTALMAVVMAYLLLLIGPFFVILWGIPGAPRRWGNGWLNELATQVMLSFVAFLIFTGVLALIGALLGAAAAVGWLMISLLALVAVMAAMKLRSRLESIFGIGSAGGGFMSQYVGGRMLMKGLGALSRTRMPNMPSMPRRRSKAPAKDEGAPQQSTRAARQITSGKSKEVTVRRQQSMQRRRPSGPKPPEDHGYVHAQPVRPPSLPPSGAAAPEPAPGPRSPQRRLPPARRRLSAPQSAPSVPLSAPAAGQQPAAPSTPAYSTRPEPSRTHQQPRPQQQRPQPGRTRPAGAGRQRPARPGLVHYSRPDIPDAPRSRPASLPRRGPRPHIPRERPMVLQGEIVNKR